MNSCKPPLLLKQSVLLIGAAILLGMVAETANAQTTTGNDKVTIGRLPSFHAGDGAVVGVKPNVFLIIDNGKSMTGSKNQMEYDPNGNYLQQTAGALIAALPQLEGKVRLGYSTIFPGTYALSGIKYGGKQLSCQEFKLNGNVNRLDPFIPGLKADLAKNPNYVTGDEDFVFNDSGSGYGNTVPRDFRDNYARYIYAWLGAMCMGSNSDKDGVKYNNPWNAPLVPPYADLNDKVAYQAAASAAKNKNSYPVANFIGMNVPPKTRKPLIDMYVRILGQISDEDFICSLVQDENNTGGSQCLYTDLSAERGAHGNATLRNYPEHPQWKYLTYDAYAPTRDDNGFPDDKNPLSCRKNYTIMITHSAYGKPGTHLRNNSKVGTEGDGIDGKGGTDGWQMPNGREFPRSGYLGEITRMYRFLPTEGDARVHDIPKDSIGGKTINGAAGAFLLSKMIFQSYYQDLRSNLPDDVPPYIAGPTRRHGPKNRGIPPFWDRKNDTAPWQHMTFFALGFTDEKGSSFPSWQHANKMYKPYYNNLDPEGGILEPYFRAIEDGSIYAENQPLPDWGRGGYGLSSLSLTHYFYKNPITHVKEDVVIAPPHFQGSADLRALDTLGDMDYAKAGMIGRGGAYEITDYTSIKKVIKSIADRIETATAQGISGGTVGGGGRVTASQQATTGNDSILFTTFLDQETASGNIFAFKNCPLIRERIPDESNPGSNKKNPEWDENDCGKRLWNAASVLFDNSNAIEAKTIVPIKLGDQLIGATFNWNTISGDPELKTALTEGGNDALGKARVEWLNGKLQSQLDPSVASKIRTRSTIFIPDEKQRFKRNADGSLEKDDDGNVVLADPTNIPNLMGDVVYAQPKAVDNRGTLPAAHPLNDEDYNDFLKNTVRLRQPLVLAGSNDGRLYGFSVARKGATAAEYENAALAFSFIPRTVITKNNDNLTSYTTESGLLKVQQGFADGLVNGPFTVRDAKINGQWGTYVVGTLGQGGDGIYALDISNGRANTNIFKWEVSGRGYGSIMAEPRIIWLRSKNDTSGKPQGKWVVVLPTGYNADTVSLVILDLADGSELAKINTTARFKTASDDEAKGTKTCTLSDLTSEEEANKNTKALWDNLKGNKDKDKDKPNLGTAKIPFSTHLNCSNGLGQLTVFDADSDSGADFVFAGDLLGHVWKFDLRGFFDSSSSTGAVANDLNTALKVAYNAPLFIAQTPGDINTSTRQPITSMIEIDDGAYGEGSMLYFGTGRMFNQKEREFTQQESFYGVWDIPRYTEQEKKPQDFSLPLRRNKDLAPSGSKYKFIQYETFNIPTSDVVDPKSTLKNFKEIRGVRRTDSLTSSEFLSYDLAGQNVNSDNVNVAVGWIIDFPANSKERVINRSYTFEDGLFFPTFTPQGGSNNETCQPDRSGVGGEARFYMVNRLTGGQLEQSPFDFNDDGTQDAEDGVKVNPADLGNSNHKLDYSVPLRDGKLPISPASIKIRSGSGDFLSVIGVLERSKQAVNKHNCDYSRQVIFPSTVDPATGNPLVLTSCNRNRYRVWKQPVIE